jgi:hypothetical protein
MIFKDGQAIHERYEQVKEGAEGWGELKLNNTQIIIVPFSII